MDKRIFKTVEKSMDEYHERFERFFPRSEPREQSLKYMKGLIAAPDRRNGWELAEMAGDRCPDRVQRLMYRNNWDLEGVLDEHIRFCNEHFGHYDGTFIVDETGFLKSGKSSAGVNRQYTGTAGKITNCQVGVFLGYTSEHGNALLDRRLYMPDSWISDSKRCARAKVPDDLQFLTKPQLALEMVRHAVFDLQCSGSWVVGDEVYGMDPCFREGLADLNLRFVLAVKRNMKVGKVSGCKVGRIPLSFWPENTSMSLEKIAAGLPDSYWKSLATRAGERGPIRYEWAGLRVIVPDEGERWLLIRRSLKHSDDLSFYFSNAYSDTPVMQLAEVALRRFAIEQCFAEAKTEAGLDEYEVRLWHAWYRHITLSMMAHAFLSALKKTLEDRIKNVSANCERHSQMVSNSKNGVVRRRVFHGLDQFQAPQKDSGNARALPRKILQAGSK